jgi:hypothetical protein
MNASGLIMSRFGTQLLRLITRVNRCSNVDVEIQPLLQSGLSNQAASVQPIRRILARHMRRWTQRCNDYLLAPLGVRLVSRGEIPSLSRQWFDRLFYFHRLFGLIEDVPGDVVECGVAFGQSLAMLTALVRSGRQRHIWGFDSWQGLPSPRPEDGPSLGLPVNEGTWGLATPRAVIATLKSYGFNDAEIEIPTLVPGAFSSTLPKYNGDNIALLHIDAELFQSYIEVLANLWPKLSIGGIAAFDEYEVQNLPGVRQAVDEFFSQQPSGCVSLRQDRVYRKCFAVKLQ